MNKLIRLPRSRAGQKELIILASRLSSLHQSLASITIPFSWPAGSWVRQAPRLGWSRRTASVLLGYVQERERERSEEEIIARPRPSPSAPNPHAQTRRAAGAHTHITAAARQPYPAQKTRQKQIRFPFSVFLPRPPRTLRVRTSRRFINRRRHLPLPLGLRSRDPLPPRSCRICFGGGGSE